MDIRPPRRLVRRVHPTTCSCPIYDGPLSCSGSAAGTPLEVEKIQRGQTDFSKTGTPVSFCILGHLGNLMNARSAIQREHLELSLGLSGGSAGPDIQQFADSLRCLEAGAG